MKKTLERSLSILLVVAMVCSIFSITVFAASSVITLGGGYRSLNGETYTATLNEKLLNLDGNTYTDESGVVYTVDKENHTITFATDEDGYFYFPENFFVLEGYTQNGWGNNASRNSGNYAVGRKLKATADKTYYARYDTKKFTLELLPGEYGEGDSQSLSNKTYGQIVNLPDAIFTRPGYIQAGWSTAEDSEVVEYELAGNFKIFDDTQLYPVWEPIIYDFIKTQESIDFGCICEGYTDEIQSVEIKITNYSNTAAVFTMPESECYDISCSADTVEIGRAIVLQISPKASLTAGEYVEQLTFGVNNFDTTIMIQASFEVLASNGHSNGDWIVSQEPTCTENGSKHKECTICGYENEVTEIPAKGHSFVDSVCSVCESNLFSYDVTEEGITITGLLCAQNELVIPATIDGMTVIAIGDGAFYQCDDITSVEISEGVTHIGADAFGFCSNLVSVSIPGSVKSIGSTAFALSDALESINIVDIEAWCEIEFSDALSNPLLDINVLVGNSSYKRTLYIEGNPITELVLPDNVTAIGDYAFAGYMELTSVVISDNVQTIGESAFIWCSCLETITIGRGVSNIGDLTFGCCGSLECINVDENNSSYISVDGVLFDKKKTWLIQYPAGKSRDEYEIPESVIDIGVGAFSECSGLINVAIPENVTVIRNDTFYGCSGLTSITIPEGVTNIGSSAFYGCSGLTTIMIPESVTEIGSDAFMNCTSLSTVEFGEEIISVGQNAFAGCTGLKYAIFSQMKIENISSYFSFSNATVTSTTASVYIGTGDVITIDGGPATEFVCVVKNDTNGDGVCDVLDAAQVALVSNGHRTLDGAYALAADSNSDDMVDVNDYQSIVNKAVS